MLEINEHHGGGSLLSEELMEKRTATCMTNRHAVLNPLRAPRAKTARASLSRQSGLSPTVTKDWLATSEQKRRIGRPAGSGTAAGNGRL
jgi:hypothetical protein